jgi:uncharacterized membrane protein YkoI
MTKRRRYLIVGVVALAISAGGAAVALATGDDEDATVTGPGADRAQAAALRLTGGGAANAVERDSENGATWEVEVTKPDGQTVDVRLDESYHLVTVEGDSEDAVEGTGDD